MEDKLPKVEEIKHEAPEFKAGDKVIPSKFSSEDYPKILWIDPMDKYVDKVNTVKSVENDRVTLDSYYMWPKDKITLASPSWEDKVIETKPVESIHVDLADRYNSGKLKWSLVDFPSLEEMVKVLEFGAKKYSPNNWKKGLKVTEITDSLMRHLVAFNNGENDDPESGISHIGHILCNGMFLTHMLKNRPEMDDRFKP